MDLADFWPAVDEVIEVPNVDATLASFTGMKPRKRR